MRNTLQLRSSANSSAGNLHRFRMYTPRLARSTGRSGKRLLFSGAVHGRRPRAPSTGAVRAPSWGAFRAPHSGAELGRRPRAPSSGASLGRRTRAPSSGAVLGRRPRAPVSGAVLGSRPRASTASDEGLPVLHPLRSASVHSVPPHCDNADPTARCHPRQGWRHPDHTPSTNLTVRHHRPPLQDMTWAGLEARQSKRPRSPCERPSCP